MTPDPRQPHPACEIVGPERDPGWIVLCDHASNRVPPEIAGGALGLAPADMAHHIACDVGARGAALALAEALGAPLIEPNRGEDDPTPLMKLHDGSIIPGDRTSDAAERERRLTLFHRPYHAAIEGLIDRAVAGGVSPRLLSVHSFTPQLQGGPRRPWAIGLLWGAGRPLVPPGLRPPVSAE